MGKTNENLNFNITIFNISSCTKWSQIFAKEKHFKFHQLMSETPEHDERLTFSSIFIHWNPDFCAFSGEELTNE